MSSVLIHGMEMPNCCDKCGFGRWSNLHQTAACAIHNYDACFEDFSVDYRKKRSEFCPLVEVKEPHGRLIDADKLMMSLADWWYSSFGQEETDEAKAIRAVMQQVEKSIDEMTAIEAEGSEE